MQLHNHQKEVNQVLFNSDGSATCPFCGKLVSFITKEARKTTKCSHTRAAGIETKNNSVLRFEKS